MTKVPLISTDDSLEIAREYEIGEVECPFCHKMVKPELLAALQQ